MNFKGETEHSEGVQISTSMKVGAWKVQPYIGASLHKDKEDIMFPSQSGKNDPINNIGLTITRDF